MGWSPDVRLQGRLSMYTTLACRSPPLQEVNTYRNMRSATSEFVNRISCGHRHIQLHTRALPLASTYTAHKSAQQVRVCAWVEFCTLGAAYQYTQYTVNNGSLLLGHVSKILSKVSNRPNTDTFLC